MPKERVSGPSGVVVTLAEAKAHLNVDFANDDTLIEGYVEAATGAIENYLLAPIRSEVWRHFYTGWGSRLVVFDQRVRSVDVVKYYDEADGLQTLAGANYVVDTQSPIKGVVWRASASLPEVNADRVYPVYCDVTTGFATPPDAIKLAIKTLTATFYANRETEIAGSGITVANLKRNFEFLLGPYRGTYL